MIKDALIKKVEVDIEMGKVQALALAQAKLDALKSL